MASKILFLFFLLFLTSYVHGQERPNPNVWDFQIARKVIAAFHLNGMSMSIWEDQSIESTTAVSKRQFYVTPLTEFLPESVQCQFNSITKVNFVSYSIQMWNERLQLAAVDRLKLMGIDVKGEQVQPLPFYQVRVVWHNTQEKLNKASLSPTWNNNLQQRSIHRFRIITNDNETCHEMATVMKTQPEFFTESISLEYSLSAAKTATKTIAVKTEHLLNSQLIASLSSMDVQTNERFLKSEDANRLTLEIVDNVQATELVEGAYVPNSDQMSLKELINMALQLRNADDKSKFTGRMWESVYWDPDFARPDKVSSFLNKVLDINQGNHTVTKSDQYENSKEANAKFSIGSLFSGGGGGGSQSRGSASFADMLSWLFLNNYEVEIKGNIFVPKSLDLKRVNLGVLSRQGSIVTKSVQIHSIDAPGTLKITVGSQQPIGSDDVKGLRQQVQSLQQQGTVFDQKFTTGINQLNARVDGVTGTVNGIQTDLSSRIDAFNNELSASVGKKVAGCRICFQETEGSSQCQGTRSSCSGWSHQGAGWNAPFRDDTDGRGGGCTYQWRIECVL